ncbi:MAG: hypothetical protein HYY18_02285 [Planctomycetes bacterium]|nr:hypothetical protein [Planctomycetota bacterium]
MNIDRMAAWTQFQARMQADAGSAIVPTSLMLSGLQSNPVAQPRDIPGMTIAMKQGNVEPIRLALSDSDSMLMAIPAGLPVDQAFPQEMPLVLAGLHDLDRIMQPVQTQMWGGGWFEIGWPCMGEFEMTVLTHKAYPGSWATFTEVFPEFARAFHWLTSRGSADPKWTGHSPFDDAWAKYKKMLEHYKKEANGSACHEAYSFAAARCGLATCTGAQCKPRSVKCEGLGPDLSEPAEPGGSIPIMHPDGIPGNYVKKYYRHRIRLSSDCACQA